MKVILINWVRKGLIVISVLVIYLAPKTIKAQQGIGNSSALNYFYIQLNSGLSEYFGDFNKDKYLNQKPKFALGVVFGYQVRPVIGLRTQFLKTNLYSKRMDQNTVFNSNLWDGAVNITINLNEIILKIRGIQNPYRLIDFYLFSGGGVSSFKSKLSDLETGEIFREHTQWQYEFFLPVGAGAAFRLNNKFSVYLEYGDHIIFNGTKLDFTDNSKKNNDHYSYISAGLQFRFGYKDSDNDGVPDKVDLCPETLGKVELGGCPDSDNDGIADKDDACPYEAGKAEFKGCPDTDGDGVIDNQDACPDAAGKKELNGCPDRDNDGIADKDDKCPEVAGIKELAGCPDRDGDGIADKDDECPDDKGLAIFNGCPDTDGDGIIDKLDSCIFNSGTKAFNGCPDRDNDGIADKDDKCPDVAGKKELFGCPDRDGDGIADNDDACPYYKGLVRFNGCPDTDGDGIPDNIDNCPDIAGSIADKGCPKAVKGSITLLQKKVYFGSGSSEFLPTFGNTLSLDEIVKSINNNPEAIITVTGYEDSSETGTNGEKLSEKRADYVINYLKQKGMKSLKIKKLFFGKSKPVAGNNTTEGQALNRRVEIKISK